MKIYLDTANTDDIRKGVQMLSHPLTDAGLKRFSEDWKKVPTGV